VRREDGQEPQGVSSSNKREREIARAKYERQQQRRAERAAQSKRRNQVVAVVAALVVVVGAVLALVLTNRSGDEVADGGTSPSASASPSTSASASPSESASGSASATPTVSVEGCTTAPAPTTKTETWTSPPADTRPAGAKTTLTLATNCGDIVIEMVPNEKAPQTTTSMAFLADQGYYTDSDCFRLTTSGLFVLQCGSPNNDGTGGPGYTLPDENLPSATGVNYPEGTVAMANAGPGTAGSQFFIVYKDTTLPANYTIWGTVVSGLDVVQKVADAGVAADSTNPNDGKPAQPIVITKATAVTPAG